MKCQRTFFLISLFIFFVFIDQLTKYIIRSFGGFYICNSGIAFGLKIAPLFFYSLWAIIIATIIITFLTNNCSLKSYSSIFILAGAFSNIFDRLRYGCVIDFINLKFWPIFNLADIFICLGVSLLIVRFSTTDHLLSKKGR